MAISVKDELRKLTGWEREAWNEEAFLELRDLEYWSIIERHIQTQTYSVKEVNVSNSIQPPMDIPQEEVQNFFLLAFTQVGPVSSAQRGAMSPTTFPEVTRWGHMSEYVAFRASAFGDTYNVPLDAKHPLSLHKYRAWCELKLKELREVRDENPDSSRA